MSVRQAVWGLHCSKRAPWPWPEGSLAAGAPGRAGTEAVSLCLPWCQLLPAEGQVLSVFLPSL